MIVDKPNTEASLNGSNTLVSLASFSSNKSSNSTVEYAFSIKGKIHD